MRTTIKLSRDSAIRFNANLWILYLLLLMAFANASLRFTPSGFSTFYRLFSPLVIICIVIINRRELSRFLQFFIFAIVYSLIVSTIFYGNIIYEYYINLLYVAGIFIIVFRIREIDDSFDDSFFRFLDVATIVIILLAFLQMIIHIPYPFVNILPKRTSVNIFFSNENELGEPLACMALIYMARHFVKHEKKHLIKLIAIFVLLFLLDAKLSILGVIVGALITIAYTGNIVRSKKGGLRRFIFAGLILLSLILILSLTNVNLKFRDYDITINRLIIDYIKRIVRLENFTSGGGSMIDRTNAIIFGLKELKSTGFLGIGFGNSVYMLSMPKYHLQTAQSMHNIFFQLICEFGYVAIVGYYLILKSVLKGIKTNVNWISVLKLVYCFSFILISSQSSVGILSNYMTWAITFYVAMFGSEMHNSLNTHE